jgi:low affinity Fe/Cu permease
LSLDVGPEGRATPHGKNAPHGHDSAAAEWGTMEPGGGTMATVDMPSQVSGRQTAFDRFAGPAAHMVSRAPFFAFCVLLIVVWAPTFVLLKFDTWQLIINTVTTIITFLMVALLQNTQTRNDQATQHKLNAMADALADLMTHFGNQYGSEIEKDIEELRDAVGLEARESVSR